MLDRGDDEGRLVWVRIRRAIEALQAPPDDKPNKGQKFRLPRGDPLGGYRGGWSEVRFCDRRPTGGPVDYHRVPQMHRVEMSRRGGRSNISVATPFVWRRLTGLAVAPFPHPAHRTGQAELPHPALGQDVYHVLISGELYHDLGPDHFDRRSKTTQTRRLVARLQNLGFAVQITPLPL